MNNSIKNTDNKYIQELINDFNRITRMKYISFPNEYSAGVNLENLLNKSGGCFNIADFGDVEIKTLEYKKMYKDFSLFTCRPDGPYVFPMKEISQKYGYPDKDYRDVKVIKGDVYGNKFNKIGLFYYFKLIVDYKKERVNLAVYNTKMELIAIEAFWDFDSLIEKLERKFKYLAIFFYKSYIDNDTKYYWFNKLDLYYLKDKNIFIKLIEDGIIKITLTCGVAKSGPYIGKFVDHGSELRISRFDIEKLFKKINL